MLHMRRIGSVLRRFAPALALTAMVAIGEGAATAGEVGAQLDYEAVPGCPVAAAFEAIVAERLGYSPFRDGASERVVIRIGASARALEGRVEWRHEGGAWAGERTFPSRSADCGELTRAMGFAVALQFQLLAAAQTSAQSPGAAPTVAHPATETAAAPTLSTSPSPPALSSSREAPARAGRPRPSINAGAGAFAAVGLSPNVAALGRLFGTVAWPHVAVELAVEASVPSALHRADGAGFSQQVVLAGLAGCAVDGRWSACLLGKIGELRVVGQGVDLPGTASAPFIQTGLRLAVTQMLGQRALIAVRGEGLTPITRGIVTLDSMPVWTTPRVAGTFGLDFGVRFQ